MDQNTSRDVAINIGNSADSNDNFFALRPAGSVAGDPIQASTLAGSLASATTTTGYTVGTWHHIAGVYAAVDDRSAYIDGGSKGTNTASRTPSGVNQLRIGSRTGTSPSGHLDGQIAECAIWNVALADAEIAVLATGVIPPLVRPSALVHYAPLTRNLIDIVGGVTLTNTGTTVVTHPRVFYRVPSMVAKPSAVIARRRSPRPLFLNNVFDSWKWGLVGGPLAWIIRRRMTLERQRGDTLHR